MIKLKLAVLFFITTINSVLLSQADYKKWNFNIVNSGGYSHTWSDEPSAGLPYELAVRLNGFQSFHLGEIIFNPTDQFGIGLGGGINLRSGDYIYGERNYSDKYYLALQFRNVKRSFMFQTEIGVMKGVIVDSYLKHIGLGIAWCFLNQKKINIHLRPFIEFDFSEQKTKSGHHPHDYNAPYYTEHYYTLTFKTVSLNFALVVGF